MKTLIKSRIGNLNQKSTENILQPKFCASSCARGKQLLIIASCNGNRKTMSSIKDNEQSLNENEEEGSIYPMQMTKSQSNTYTADLDWSHFRHNSKIQQPRQFYFFYLDFLSRTFTNHRTAGEGGGQFFNSSIPLPPASQTVSHQPGYY